jgi:phosphopantothenoylcysteine decarboxylase
MILVPAMNTAMWEHPVTAQQLSTFEAFGRKTNYGDLSNRDSFESLVRILEPQSKRLACGEVGVGAMADVSSIVDFVRDTLIHK